MIKPGKHYRVIASERFPNGLLRPEPLDVFVVLPAFKGEAGWLAYGEPSYIQAGEVIMALGECSKDEAVCLWGEQCFIVLEYCLEEV